MEGLCTKSAVISKRFTRYGWKYPQIKADSLHFNLTVLVSKPKCWSTEPKQQQQQQTCHCPNTFGARCILCYLCRIYFYALLNNRSSGQCSVQCMRQSLVHPELPLLSPLEVCKLHTQLYHHLIMTTEWVPSSHRKTQHFTLGKTLDRSWKVVQIRYSEKFRSFQLWFHTSYCLQHIGDKVKSKGHLGVKDW